MHDKLIIEDILKEGDITRPSNSSSNQNGIIKHKGKNYEYDFDTDRDLLNILDKVWFLGPNPSSHQPLVVGFMMKATGIKPKLVRVIGGDAPTPDHAGTVSDERPQGLRPAFSVYNVKTETLMRHMFDHPNLSKLSYVSYDEPQSGQYTNIEVDKYGIWVR